MPENIVIIGGGTSAYYIARNLRKEGCDSPIYIISEEKYLPYNRVLLPRFLKDEISIDKVFFADNDWYQENNITLYGGVTVIPWIDVQNTVSTPLRYRLEVEKSSNTPTFAHNQSQELYEKYISKQTADEVLESIVTNTANTFVIATGGRARIPSDYNNINSLYTWRTLDDTLRIKQILQSSTSNKLAIIGGSFIGMELVMAAHHYGKDYDWIVQTESLLRDSFDTQIQDKLNGLGVENGYTKPYLNSGLIDIHNIDSQSVAATIYNKTLNKAITANTQYEGILLGTGVEPAVSIPKQFLLHNSVYYAGDMVSYSFNEQDMVTGSFNQAIKIAKYIAQDIIGSTVIADIKEDIIADIAMTPYQIKYAGTSVRLAGIVGFVDTQKNQKVRSEVIIDRDIITQKWYYDDECIGYCII